MMRKERATERKNTNKQQPFKKQHQQTQPMLNSNTTYKTANQRAQQIYDEKQKLKEKQREEEEKKAAEKREAQEKYKETKKSKFKALCAKTKSSQIKMGKQMDNLLEKINKNLKK